MKLSAHFSLDELIASETALRRGIDNTPNASVIANLKRLAEMLEKVRAVLGQPMHISSGYRSPMLNAAVGGANNPPSAHIKGLAADFVCPSYGKPLAICRHLESAGILFDQIIEEGTWVHFSIAEEGKKPRREVLTARFKDGKVSYSKGLS
jgi:zinc D-Ala-D-Ala carboxypeptidase